jgi:NADPH2:quinone reductase
MKALRFGKFGPPSVLAIEEVLRPEPRNGELLVQVKAAAINPSDVKNVAGLFSQTTLPRTPGRDFSGIVMIDSKSEENRKEVWGTGPGLGLTRDGAHAQYISVPAEFVSAKPATLSFEQAAAIGVPFTTAFAAVIGAGRLKAGETILITGAAGAVGSAAVQIANWKQASVLAADVRSDPIPGARAVINTKTEDLRQRVLDLTGGNGVDFVFDTVGGPLFEPALRSLRAGGRQVAITSTGGSRVSFDLVDFYHNQSHLIGVDSNKFAPNELRMIMADLNRGFAAGALRAPAVEGVPFERAVESYEKVAAHTEAVKQILTFAK